MTHNLEQLPTINQEQWDEWQALSHVAPEDIFSPFPNGDLNEICSQLSITFKDNPKELLLAMLSPEIQKLLQIPEEKQLSIAELVEIRDAILSCDLAELKYETNEEEYLTYLEKTLGISRDDPDFVKTFEDGQNEKVIAHTALAFKHLTEKESHVVPLNDLTSIIAHALYLYAHHLKPWWDFATKNDYSSKDNHDITKKKSAPLYRDKDCPTIAHFFAKVIPKIMELREKDSTAAIKIFPQGKNVEAFNWRISKDRDGNTIWIFEWYPGAYTPREGEDKSIIVVKNSKLTKEERIVRATIKFDSEGKPIVGLKKKKDYTGKDLPFKVPEKRVDIQNLFMRAIVANNGGGDTIPSNDPFVFIKYLASSPRIKYLIENFEQVHAGFGYADMVISGMLGPDTAFFMDIDLITPKNKKSDASYIKSLRKSSRIRHHKSCEYLLNNILYAPIMNEFELQTIGLIESDLSPYLYEIFDKAAAGYVDHALLRDVIGMLELTDIDFQQDFRTLSREKLYLGATLSRREYDLLKHMWQHRKKATTEIAKSAKPKKGMAKLYADLQSPTQSNLRPALPGTITPTDTDVSRATRRRHVSPSVLSRKFKTVADL